MLADYGAQIQSFLSENSENEKESSGFKTPQEIDVRSRMVDWMLQVVKQMGCQESSFLRSVQLFDAYFAKSTEEATVANVHLVGTVCLFIGTKLEDVSPLLMKTVLTKLAENTYSEETIRAKEQEILKVLEFKLSTPTVLELVESQLYQLNIG